MDYQLLKAEVEQKTAQTLEVLKTEYAGLRTGRASVHLLDGIRVPVYGAEMPINQVATVATPDNQTLSVTVWDITNAPAVEKAIRDSGLGLNPMTAGGVIRLNMPPLTEERRRELTKVAGKKLPTFIFILLISFSKTLCYITSITPIHFFYGVI